MDKRFFHNKNRTLEIFFMLNRMCDQCAMDCKYETKSQRTQKNARIAVEIMKITEQG